jgi:hypothetical protein
MQLPARSPQASAAEARHPGVQRARAHSGLRSLISPQFGSNLAIKPITCLRSGSGTLNLSSVAARSRLDATYSFFVIPIPACEVLMSRPRKQVDPSAEAAMSWWGDRIMGAIVATVLAFVDNRAGWPENQR